MELAPTREAASPAAGDPSDAEWQDFWRGHSVESEIAMADFYGLRHVLLKFLPRHGTVLEAGCGLGRYVFYLRGLAVQAIGCERLLSALVAARRWAQRERPESADAFSAADVRRLPFRDGSLSGYISLGVVEHFPEGPEGAIREAFRVLEPGGVALFEVPNARALDGYVHRSRHALATVLGRARAGADSMHEEPLAHRDLRRMMERAGFLSLFSRAVDLVYPAWSLGVSPSWYPILHRLEDTMLGQLGGLAVAVGIKPGPKMACFACGARAASMEGSLVPFCSGCRSALPPDVLSAYSPERIGRVRWRQLERDPAPSSGPCFHCGAPCVPDRHFGDWGFAVPVCAACLRQPVVSLTLTERALKRQWRPRGRQAPASPEAA
jgi:SAM-dependent methyltransferase